MEWLLKLAPTLFALVGKILGWNREDSRANRDTRRKAYTTWLASEGLVHHRLRAVCEQLRGFPRGSANHDAVQNNVDKLLDELRPLVISLNEAILSEPERKIRITLQALHDRLLWILGELDFAARHYTENLHLHKSLNSNIARLLALEAELQTLQQGPPKSAPANKELPIEYVNDLKHRLNEAASQIRRNRTLAEAERDLFLDHDKMCPFKSAAFGERLLAAADEVHAHAAILREAVARSLRS